MKFNKFHYQLKELHEVLQDHMNRCCHLLDKNPDDPRYEETMMQLNVWQSISNYISGSPDTTIRSENYDYMVRTFNESKKIGQFQKRESKKNEETKVPDITLGIYSTVPELADQNHYEERQALEKETVKTN